LVQLSAYDLKALQMNKRYRIMLLVGLFYICCNQITNSQSEIYPYAYLALNDDGMTELILLEINETINSTRIALPFLQNAQVRAYIPNPNHEWILFAFADNNSDLSVFYLFNSRSGDFIEILQGHLSNPSTGFSGLHLQNIAWSPDGQYLAISVAVDNQNDIYLYDVVNQTLINLSEDVQEQYRFAWSANSQYLVASEEYCSDVFDLATCSLMLKVYEVSTQTIIAAQPIAEHYGGSAAPGNSICELKWSPSGEFIAFVARCDSTLFFITQEVYLWDISQQNIITITAFTTQRLRQSNSIPVSAIYDTVWFDENTLLIGVLVGSDGNIDTFQTLTYDVDNSILSSLLTNRAATQWAINPVNNTVAFSTITAYSAFANQTYQLEIAQFNSTALNIRFQGSIACNLDWSPDGTILAYTENGTSCNLPPQRFVFLDPESGESQTYDPTNYISNLTRVYSVGWVSPPTIPSTQP
jgi:WD40 repeat protein